MSAWEGTFMPLEGRLPMTATVRPATADDTRHFMRVFDLAGDGLAAHLWSEMAGPEADADAVGYERIKGKLLAAAPGTAFVAEIDGQVAGGVISYDIGDEPEAIEPDTNPIVVPLIELENEAPLTHYVNALAAFPEFRGQGIGRALLRKACERQGSKGSSLIVMDHKETAIRLYESEGFAEAGRRPVVTSKGWSIPARDMILMMRPAQ